MPACALRLQAMSSQAKALIGMQASCSTQNPHCLQ